MHKPDLSTSPLSNSDSLLTALFIAAIVHIVIVLGINFTAPQPPRINKSLEITISHTPLKNAPTNAKFLAQDNQLGAGDENRKPEPSAEIRPQPIAPHTENPSPINQKATTAQQKSAEQKVLTQTKAAQAIATAPEATKQESVPVATETKPKLSTEALQQQIADLGEKFRNSQEGSENSKIKFVSSVSTHKYLASQYVKDWEDKVERTGNLNYPESARKITNAQMLTMDVGINADGSIYSMRIVKSSGNKALDEAAKRIVKMSAPFAELPTELLQEGDVLVITRVWKFSDETGMTAK